ncbi:hypothetical protein OAG68_01885 [bacterium]|nr:hypothetical protein [bacterium]
MPSIAFLTVANQDEWVMDDVLAYTALRNAGWQLDEIVWDSDTDWDHYDIVAIRSPWDYQHRLEQFLKVLERIENSSASLHNSLALVQWNIDKNYLFQLEREGIEIVPTHRLDQPTPDDVRQLFQHFDSAGVVLKPTVSANADDTFRIRPNTPDDELGDICKIYSTKTCLAQPFMSGIIDEGEFSLIYFNGQLSHCIIKTTKQGDFRVQEEHGGGVIPLPQPEAGLISAAEKVIAAIPELPLYARVDLVRTETNRFALMEVELIEPSLYFRFDENSPSAFAQSIDNRFTQTLS